jgi:membrane-associated protease RseP (regulator of RpoE activity)
VKQEGSIDAPFEQKAPLGMKTYIIHVGLFILTFFTATVAGVQWLNRDPLELSNFSLGLTYAILLLLMLSSHEFGHYIAARIHGVDATLPFFLPFPSVFGVFPFGTLGAVIRLKSPVTSRKAMFDIGAAGPIAGFVVSAAILVIGFMMLPAKEYLYTIHPEYAEMASIPTGGLRFGHTLFYDLAAYLFSPAGSFVPPMNEIYHYPFLCVGWFGTFVTAMNLIPVGQLDGGHIAYSMFGNAYHRIAQTSLIILMVLGTAGFLPLLGINIEFGWTGWLFWAIVLVLFLRSTRLQRPPLQDDSPLSKHRRILGWTCICILILSFSLTPIDIAVP